MYVKGYYQPLTSILPNFYHVHGKMLCTKYVNLRKNKFVEKVIPVSAVMQNFYENVDKIS